ncbi:MAG: LAGLIDADG family homing endonuclease [Candidatus Vogelbacteria bacterium]|nr:LAGLIDADG family homing endonuclease [Candidatus Vogelbacteria bacterium]
MLTAKYIVGLVDGEGSFTAYVRQPKPSKISSRRVRIEPRFFLKLIERDKVILDRLKEFFGCGQVYFQKDTRPNHQPCYRFEVSNRRDLSQIIVPFFQQHPLQLPSKAKDFKIFSQMMAAIEKGEHLTSRGLNKLYRLKQKMH